MKKMALAFLALTAAVSLASAATKDPRHPLSQIYPVDEALNMSDRAVFNVSELRLRNGLQIEGTAIQDPGNVNILEWDSTNNEWDFRNGNIDLNGNAINDADVLRAGSSGSGSLRLYTAGSGSSSVSIYDSSRSGNPRLFQANEGGPVDIRNSNLDLNGNRILNVPAPSNPGDAVNKSYVDTSDDTIADNQNLQDVLGQGNSAGSYNINMNGNNLETGGGIVSIRDTTNTLDITRFKEGGIVQIPNGNLLNISKGGTRVELDSNRIEGFYEGEANPRWKINRDLAAAGQAGIGLSYNGGSNSWGDVRLYASADNRIALGGGDVEIPNGNLRISGNSGRAGFTDLVVGDPTGDDPQLEFRDDSESPAIKSVGGDVETLTENGGNTYSVGLRIRNGSQNVEIPNGKLTVKSGDTPSIFGPNDQYGKELRVGGWGSNTEKAWVRTSNGNLHLDPESGDQTYLNWYTNTQTNFGGNADLNGNNIVGLGGSRLKTGGDGEIYLAGRGGNLETGSGSTDYWRVYDNSRNVDLMRWETGGPIKVKNADLKINSNSINSNGGSLNIDRGGFNIDIPNTCGGNHRLDTDMAWYASDNTGGCGDDPYIAHYIRNGTTESTTLEIANPNDPGDNIALNAGDGDVRVKGGFQLPVGADAY